MKYDYLHQYSAVVLSRRTLAAVSAVLVAGGTVAYIQSHRCRKIPKSEESSNHTISRENGESLSRNGVSDHPVRVARSGRKGLRSLHVLAAILLSRMGTNGIWNLMALVTTAVSFFCYVFVADCLLCFSCTIGPLSSGFSPSSLRYIFLCYMCVCVR